MTEVTVQKWIFVGDLQIPFHDKRAVALFMKVMKWWKPDIIDIVGDIDDQLEYSKFSDGTTDEFFNVLVKNQKEIEKVEAIRAKAEEKVKTLGATDVVVELPQVPTLNVNPLPFVRENALGAREFYTAVREQHPNADIHASLGNHEMRVFAYIDRKAPEIIDEVTPNMLWGLDDLGITWEMYSAPPKERYAEIHVHHGDSTTTTGLGVKNDIENYGISLVRGHDHRGGVVYKSYPMSGRSLAGMGTGHLCDPRSYGMKYTINPAWEQGFGIAHIVDGRAHLQFVPMRQYTVVLDGKVFVG